MPRINPDEVYTPAETEKLLKISKSTVKRLLKSGLLKANKVGKQYRILGHEILKMVSPDVDEKATDTYQKIKTKIVKTTKDW
jgi:excisionase family DNA binding protein